jgi:hypothetical protein
MAAAGPRFQAALVALEAELGDEAATVGSAGAALEAALRRVLSGSTVSQ